VIRAYDFLIEPFSLNFVEIGICWSTSLNPTLSSNKTSNGKGIGSFSSSITGLTANTRYYVRAYAINSAGISYGNQISFVTTPFTGIRKADFPGGPRYSSASFSIGSKVYVGIGYNDGDWPVRDFWEFDPGTDRWIQKASLPTAPARALAVGFSIGTKGYIGIGDRDPFTDGNLPDYYQDFWEWDQSTNIWTKKADFPGNTRIGAVGFSIGNKGYIGLGSDGTTFSKEFWEWDQVANVWTQKANFVGDGRSGAVSFSIGNKAYIGTGGDGSLCNDFWEWDQTTNEWTRKADFGGSARAYAVGFSIGNKAYIGTGFNGYSPYAFEDFWEYDPAN